MEIILQTTHQLGKKGDLVKVKPGYARNYLIPRGMAIVANRSNKKAALELHKQAENKDLKLRSNAQAILLLLKDCSIQIKVKVSKEGGLFGSVTPLQIAKALKEKKITLDYTQIDITEAIKKLGKYQAKINLHKDISYLLDFEVIAD